MTSHAFFLKPQVSVIPLAGEVLYEVEHEDLNAFAKDFTADWGLPVLLNILDESTVFESEGSASSSSRRPPRRRRPRRRS